MSTVLQFPKNNKNLSSVERNQKILDDIELERMENIDNVVSYATGEVVATINKMGYNVCDSYDIGLVHEAIRSMAFRTCGKEHALQTLADETVVIVDDVGNRVHANGSIATTSDTPVEQPLV